MILIGVPCSRFIFVKTAFSLTTILNAETKLVFQEGPYVHENMNNIVAQAQGCSHILFIDHDMVFEPQILTKLLAHNKDIVGTAYNYRSLPLTTMVKEADEHGYIMPAKIPDHLFKCYGVPTGCLLVKTLVFEKLKKPYFFFEHGEQGEIITGQDILFCRNAQKAGFEIWCDPTIIINHIGDYLY